MPKSKYTGKGVGNRSEAKKKKKKRNHIFTLYTVYFIISMIKYRQVQKLKIWNKRKHQKNNLRQLSHSKTRGKLSYAKSLKKKNDSFESAWADLEKFWRRGRVVASYD